MSPKLTVSQRLELIQRAQKGESIADLAREVGISRVIFYRWLRRYKKEGQSGVSPKSFGRPKKTVEKKIVYPRLSPRDRELMIREVIEQGSQVNEVAKKYGISRITLYKWIKRYKEAPEEAKDGALLSKVPHIERYFRQTPEKYEQAVLALVAKHPEYGIRKLKANLPKVGGLSIVGHHGIQNVLRRNNLSTYEMRLAYAESQVTPVTRTIGDILGVASRFFTIPQPARGEIVQKAGRVLFFIFVGIVVFGLGSFIARTFTGVAFGSTAGLVFASVALIMGSVFFLYSFKYYLTLAIVLSFSQGEGEKGGFVNGNGNGNGRKNGFASWLLSTVSGNGNGGGNGDGKNGHSRPVGLTPDLAHVSLRRQPYVSVHIPFYNEKNVVERAIEAAANFDYPEYEIVLVDDSTDETTQIIENYLRKSKTQISNTKGDGWTLTQGEIRPGVTLKHLHRLNRFGFKGGALQEALRASSPKAEFVVVFDADFVPYPDTLSLFLKYFKVENNMSEDYKASNVAAVQGYQWHVLNKSENWITRGIRAEYAGSYVIERSGTEIYGGLKQISGSVYMVRKDVLSSVGWDTSITEDFQLTLKLYERGYKVVYTPYIQAPAECVSTIKRLIRQRMRWAEGHSHNIKQMFGRLMGNSTLSGTEKFEFLYLSPYYLQASFFLIGTLSWLLSETLFPARLPFWTSLWGWSLVLTNLLSLPLMNAVGLFLEESEERDYLGLASFVALSYIMVPFQAYASIKGFLEKEEGPWFRTPKTGKITDIFTRGKFYRFIAGILPGAVPGTTELRFTSHDSRILSPYLALDTANNRFNSFSIPRSRRLSWVAKATLSILLSITTTLLFASSKARLVSANNYENIMKLGIGSTGEAVWPTWGNRFENNSNGYSTGVAWQWSNSTAQMAVTNNFMWFTNMMPNNAAGSDAVVFAGNNVMLQIGKQGGGPTTSNWINFTVQLLLTNNDATVEVSPAILQQNFQLNTTNANGTLWTFGLGNISANTNISAASPNRFALLIGVTTSRRPGTNINLWINNSAVPASLIMPAQIQVPEIPQTVVFMILVIIMPTIPAIVSGRFRKRGGNVFQEFRDAWSDILAKFLGKEEEKALDSLPV